MYGGEDRTGTWVIWGLLFTSFLLLLLILSSAPELGFAPDPGGDEPELTPDPGGDEPELAPPPGDTGVMSYNPVYSIIILLQVSTSVCTILSFIITVIMFAKQSDHEIPLLDRSEEAHQPPHNHWFYFLSISQVIWVMVGVVFLAQILSIDANYLFIFPVLANFIWILTPYFIHHDVRSFTEFGILSPSHMFWPLVGFLPLFGGLVYIWVRGTRTETLLHRIVP